VSISIQNNVPGDDYRIFSLGDSALTVEFGTTIAPELNDKATSLADHFTNEPFQGFVEAVPAYSSTTIFYDVVRVRRTFPAATAFDAVRSLVARAIQDPSPTRSQRRRQIEVPVDFSHAAALDIEFVATSHNVSVSEVIDIFTSRAYRVFMLGFLPGFAYMGEVDERIATPRKETPRTKIPRGSVGIAGRQTGIYSLDSPGGWQIIGRTDLALFLPDKEHPSFLQPGDEVKFVQAK
jgi:inhibitor of KinA